MVDQSVPKKAPDYQRESYYAVRELAYNRRLVLVAIDKAISNFADSPDERLDKVSKILEFAGMKSRETSAPASESDF
jgi:hypothetical protein